MLPKQHHGPPKTIFSGTNPEWTNIAAAFKLWEKIHAFITNTEVEEDDDYRQEIQQFEVNVK